jgi:hypothetical protein
MGSVWYQGSVLLRQIGHVQLTDAGLVKYLGSCLGMGRHRIMDSELLQVTQTPCITMPMYLSSTFGNDPFNDVWWAKSIRPALRRNNVTGQLESYDGSVYMYCAL